MRGAGQGTYCADAMPAEHLCGRNFERGDGQGDRGRPRISVARGVPSWGEASARQLTFSTSSAASKSSMVFLLRWYSRSMRMRVRTSSSSRASSSSCSRSCQAAMRCGIVGRSSYEHTACADGPRATRPESCSKRREPQKKQVRGSRSGRKARGHLKLSTRAVHERIALLLQVVLHQTEHVDPLGLTARKYGRTEQVPHKA